MPSTMRLLVIPGSTRREAWSKRLAAAAAQLAAPLAETTVVDLREHALPLYDGDLEQQGLPQQLGPLRTLVQQHDALLFATPEYNASIPAVLKNALDWLSRPFGPEPGGAVFRGKVAGLLASSPGALGGLRALVHLRQVLMNLGLLVVTEQFALGSAESAFAADGQLADPRQAAGVEKVVQSVVRVATALRG